MDGLDAGLPSLPGSVSPWTALRRVQAVGTPDPLGNVILIPPESVQMRQAVEPGRR
jgi:hypothetical protein